MDRRIFISDQKPVNQRIAHIEPMLVQCWPTVYDAGPAIKHYYVDVTVAVKVALKINCEVMDRILG